MDRHLDSHFHNEQEHWYVIQTKPGQEDRVKFHMNEMVIENFLPKMEDCVSRGRRTVKVRRPLFPNYLFAKFSLSKNYHQVKWTRGVNKVVGSGIIPLPLDQAVIDTIRQRTSGDDVVSLSQIDPFKANDPVRIKAGPFKDLIGIFQRRISASNRIKVLLNLLGKSVSVQLDQALIART